LPASPERIGTERQRAKKGRTLIARTVTVAAVAAAIAGFALPAIAAEEAAPAPLTSGKVGGTVKVTATVEQIEEAGRRQRGNQVQITYTRALAISVKAATKK
jgi:ammonia channel protein AmtB